MEKIHIITDSGCDLPPQLADKLGIEVMPFELSCGGADFSGYYGQEPSAYWQSLREADAAPKPRQITPVTYLGRFEAARKAGYTHIICITLGSEINGSYNSACVARGLFYEENAGVVTVEVIDSHTFSLAYGDLVAEAARMRAAGKTFDEICEMLKSELPRREMMFMLYDSRQVKKSGVIHGRAVFAGESAGLRPVLLSASCSMEMVSKAVPGVQAAKDLASLVMEFCGNNPAHISVHIGDVSKADSDALIKALEEAMPGREIYFVPLGVTASALVGGDVLGVVYTTP